MKKVAIIAVSAAFALALAGCGGSAQTSSNAAASSGSPSASSVSASSVSTSAAKDFDGSAYSDTGAGTMILATAGGTSEGGKVPEVAAKPGSIMQLEIDTDGMDGSVCTVYVDGMENMTMNAGERTQQVLTIQGEAVEAGLHTVELVKMDGNAPVIYKKAEYKMV